MPPFESTAASARVDDDLARPSKRRRVSLEPRQQYNNNPKSPTPSSGDELGSDSNTTHGPIPRSRSPPRAAVKPRLHSRQGSFQHHFPRSGSGYQDDDEDSPDELDHTFLRVKQDDRHHRNIRRRSGISTDVSEVTSTPHESDFDPGSSAIQSPAPLLQDEEEDEPLPEVRYEPKLILRGHKRGVSMVRFSPDGKWIASSSADTTCKIWDAHTGALKHTLQGHLAGISTIAWSPDSKILASGSDDKSIRLWDIAKGKSHPEALLGHHNYVYSVAFSPKGNMLVSGSYDEAVFLWDVRTGRLMRSLPAHSDPVGGVDFVRDGTLIVSCASDGLIRVWDTATGQCLRTFFHEDTPPVVSVKFSPNGKYILTWMLDSCLRMWNYVEGRCVKTYQGHTNEKYSLSGAFGTYTTTTTTHGGSASSSAQQRRRRQHQQRQQQRHRQHRYPDDDHDEDEDGTADADTYTDTKALVVSGSEDGSILVWDVVSKNILQKLAGHKGAVLGVDVHPTEKMIVSCGLDKTIKIWRDALSYQNSSSNNTTNSNDEEETARQQQQNNNSKNTNNNNNDDDDDDDTAPLDMDGVNING